MPIAGSAPRGGEIASSLDSSTVSAAAGCSQLLMLRRWGAYVKGRKYSKPRRGQVQPSLRQAWFPSLVPLEICPNNIVCLFGLFLCSCPLPPVPRPASRIRFQAFLFLFQLATLPVPPPHDAVLPALQTCVLRALWLPPAIPTLPEHNSHLLDRPISVFELHSPVADGKIEALIPIFLFFQYLKVSLTDFRIKGHLGVKTKSILPNLD